METNIIQNPIEQVENTETLKVEAIKEVLKKLSPPLIDSLYDYAAFLLEKEKTHRAFVEETLEIEANSDTITFDSVEEAMEAIRNWSE